MKRSMLRAGIILLLNSLPSIALQEGNTVIVRSACSGSKTLGTLGSCIADLIDKRPLSDYCHMPIVAQYLTVCKAYKDPKNAYIVFFKNESPRIVHKSFIQS